MARLLSDHQTRLEERKKYYYTHVRSWQIVLQNRKLQRYKFFAKTKSGRRFAYSQSRYRSRQWNSTREDQSPHIFTRKTRLQPAEFLVTYAKRLCNTIGTSATWSLVRLGDAIGGILLQKSKAATPRIFREKRGGRRLLIRIPSIALPKSPMSLTREDLSPTSLHRRRAYSPQNFRSPVQNDFCNSIGVCIADIAQPR
jgi:hypothetical protein